MRITFTLLILLLISSLTLYAQEKTIAITGTVTNPENKPVDVASITLVNIQDSAIVATGVSDANGSFQLKSIRAGIYQLRVSHILYQKYIVQVKVDDKNTGQIAIGTIQLQVNQNTLKEVNAKALKPLFVKEKDRLVFDVENSVINSLKTDAAELVRNLPGVWVDRQNNLLINGQEKVRVSVNGRTVFLTRGDLLQMLKSIPSSTIKAIEVITNPGAKYDAEGSVVINIKTKTNVATGFNGVLNLQEGSSIGYGRFYPKTSNGVNLSLGLNKFSFLANYTYNYARSLGMINERITFQNATLNQAIKFENLPERSHVASFGIDYKINDKQSASAYYTKNYARSIVDQGNRINLTDATEPYPGIISLAGENTTINQDALNIVYQNAIDSLSRITFSSDYLVLNKRLYGNYANTYTSQNSSSVSENVDNDVSTKIKVWVGQVDYSYNLIAKSKLETGIKYSRINTDNSVDFASLTTNPSIPDSSRLNMFSYKEWLGAVYLNYATSIKALGINAGLRYEDNRITGTSTDLRLGLKRNWSGFFPSVSFDYPLSKKLDINLSYGRSIARPKYVDINPFVYYVNPYVVLEGNPALRPSYTNKIKLNLQLEKMYSVSLSYLHTENLFTLAQFQNINTKRQRLVPANIGDLSGLELNIGIPLNPKPWWESYFDITLLYQDCREDANAGLMFFKNTQTTFQLFTQHTFTLPKNYGLELSNTLVTPSIEGQFRYNTINTVSFGIKRSFLKKKLDLKIGMSDLLKTLRYDGTLGGTGWRSNFQNRTDSRQLKFSVKYNFYKKGKVAAKSPKWISNDEKKRMK